MPIKIEHREHIYLEKPENMARMKLLEDEIDDVRDALGQANRDNELAQRQIVALEAARIAPVQRNPLHPQAITERVEIKYLDKIVEVEKAVEVEKIVERDVEKVVHVRIRDRKAEIIVGLSTSAAWMIIFLALKKFSLL